MLQILLGRRRGPASPPRLLERVGDVGDGEELLHVDDGRPVVSALLHGGEDVVVLGGVADGAEVEDEEVDDGVGGGELAPQPGDEAVALVHEPAGLLLLLVRGPRREHGHGHGGGGGGGGGDDGGGHGLGALAQWGPAVIGWEVGNARGRAWERDLGFWRVFWGLGWVAV